MFNLHPAYWINYKARMWRDQVYPVDVVIVINDLDKSWPDGLLYFFYFPQTRFLLRVRLNRVMADRCILPFYLYAQEVTIPYIYMKISIWVYQI